MQSTKADSRNDTFFWHNALQSFILWILVVSIVTERGTSLIFMYSAMEDSE